MKRGPRAVEATVEALPPFIEGQAGKAPTVQVAVGVMQALAPLVLVGAGQVPKTVETNIIEEVAPVPDLHLESLSFHTSRGCVSCP